MEWVQLLGFAFVALLLVVSPGPNGLLIAKTVPLRGKEAGFANIAGFMAAFAVHGSLSILGISVILMQSADAFFVVKMLGALYLAWIGVKAVTSAWQNTEASSNHISVESEAPLAVSRTSKKLLTKSFVEGFLTNALNPKVSMFYLAAFPQFIPVGESAIFFGAALVLLHSLMNFLWFTGMVLLFSRLTHASKSRSFQRWLKGTTGVVFIGFGAKLISLER
jgi:threonine/homoserine/homoserine lactone efflux protein